MFGEDQNLILRLQVDNPTKGALFLGNIWAAEKVQGENEEKIGAVLTVASNTDLTYNSTIVHKIIEADDDPSFNLSPNFDEGVLFIKEQLEKTNVLVHCFAGVSRSASLVIAYLMKQKGMSLNQALNLCRNKRQIVGPNLGFMKQLEKYEKNQGTSV